MATIVTVWQILESRRSLLNWTSSWVYEYVISLFEPAYLKFLPKSPHARACGTFGLTLRDKRIRCTSLHGMRWGVGWKSHSLQAFQPFNGFQYMIRTCENSMTMQSCHQLHLRLFDKSCLSCGSTKVHNSWHLLHPSLTFRYIYIYIHIYI